MTERIQEFLRNRRNEGQDVEPCLVVDLEVVRDNYQSFAKALPDSRVFYAVKANPAPEVLSLLASMGFRGGFLYRGAQCVPITVRPDSGPASRATLAIGRRCSGVGCGEWRRRGSPRARPSPARARRWRSTTAG